MRGRTLPVRLGWALFALAALPAAIAPVAHASALEAIGILAAPVQPQLFVDGWGRGLGIGGSVRFGIGRHFEYGIDAEFMQFTYTGLPGLGNLGGERRFTRIGIPIRAHLYEWESRGRERVSVQASAGYGHQSIAGIFGEGLIAHDLKKNEDGLALAGAILFSRSLYRGTRWSAGFRYTWFDFDAESPGHFGFVLGVEMPLEGSRPH